MKISIVMPCLNEEKAICRQLDEIPLQELKKRGYSAEIIIIDGQSTDKTAEIAKNKGAIVYTSKRGYGRQYKLGFRKVSGDIIATADSDLSYPVELIPGLVDYLIKHKLDFITVNRFADSKQGSFRALNWLGNHILTFFTNLFFSVNLKDSQSGMWIFRRKILEKLKLTINGMPFSEETKIEAFKKTRAKEVPGSYSKRVGTAKLKRFKDGYKNMEFLFLKRLK